LSLFILLPLPAFAAGQALEDDGVVGTILEVEGSGTVTPPGGTATPAAVNTPVHLNDTVQTGAQSRIFIQFIDETELTLSENAKATIDNYVFDADDNSQNKAAYSIMDGAFQYVSGLIGHKENPDVRVDTPVGSIGVRGTNFWGGNIDGDYNVAVNEGQVALKTDAGEETVNKGEGTSVHDRSLRPARAAALDPAKFQRMRNTVFLKRRQMVRQRVGMMKRRNQFLRKRYKKFMHRRQQGQRGQQQLQRLGQREGQQQQQYQQGQGQGQQDWQRERQMRRRERMREMQEQNQGGQ
jgi:hypothetical protein